MPTIGTVDLSTVDILPAKTALLRETYMETIQAMMADKAPRLITPDQGETLRRLKVNLTRSANDYDVRLIMQETRDGSLVVQLDESPLKVRKTRAPRVNGTASGGLELPDDAGEEAPA